MQFCQGVVVKHFQEADRVTNITSVCALCFSFLCGLCRISKKGTFIWTMYNNLASLPSHFSFALDLSKNVEHTLKLIHLV